MTTTRTKADEERLERETREAAEALAIRAREVAAMDDATLCRDATDAELRAERDRLAAAGVPSTRGILTTHRPRARERLAGAREALPGALADAITTAARECARPEGPTLETLRRVRDLDSLSTAPAGIWKAITRAIDAPAPAGMSEVFSDTDHQAEARAAARAFDVRRSRISDELEARAIAASAASRPGMAARIASLTSEKGKVGGEPGTCRRPTPPSTRRMPDVLRKHPVELAGKHVKIAVSAHHLPHLATAKRLHCGDDRVRRLQTLGLLENDFEDRSYLFHHLLVRRLLDRIVHHHRELLSELFLVH